MFIAMLNFIGTMFFLGLILICAAQAMNLIFNRPARTKK